MVLILVAVALMLLLAVTGLAIDCSRILVTRGIAQGRLDAAALAAVLELDGTRQGIDRARQAAALAAGGLLDNLRGEFAAAPASAWEENPRSPALFRFARVSASIRVRLTMLRTIVQKEATEFRAVATGAQQPQSPLPPDVIPDQKSLSRRLSEDTDFTARSYAEYAARGRGNGRRIVPSPEGARFILPASAPAAIPSTEPIGAYLQGSRWKGAGESGYLTAVLLR